MAQWLLRKLKGEPRISEPHNQGQPPQPEVGHHWVMAEQALMGFKSEQNLELGAWHLELPVVAQPW